MKTRASVVGVGVLALTLASCAPPHPAPRQPLKTISRLNCPQTEGELTLKSAPADGQSCVYTPDDGGVVTLQLLALDGKTPGEALAPLEASLASEIPARSETSAGDGNVKIDSHEDGPSHDKDKVDIDLPGLHIHAAGDGASVRHDPAAGEGPGKGGLQIDAGDNGARIHMTEPGDGVRLSFILASDKAGPNGYKAVGYEARGPSAGPLVVAVIKTTHDDHDDLRHDIRSLLKHNVGG